jgi:hypothetical protein
MNALPYLDMTRLMSWQQNGPGQTVIYNPIMVILDSQKRRVAFGGIEYPAQSYRSQSAGMVGRPGD